MIKTRQMNWHSINITDVFPLLQTGPQGLSTVVAEQRLLQDGINELPEAKRKNILLILLARFKDVMILILLAAAIISGIVGDVTDSIVILVIVLLNALIGFFQE
jgi:Ca2+-transporting ATPase